ncbi:hypothetical protein AVEN_207668-1 [Araneus ventricosus]|uniref:Uncharacterized protein n=1 Tax=Araneus ventricosus TaxID=182803 RepID=A0A4Y2KT59_ARAVE|nr:hypothetical protein AVEN_207668-1 [Araneus ventricosus]
MKQSKLADEQVVLDMPVGSVSDDSVFPSGPSRLSKMADSVGDKADPNGLNGIHHMKTPLEIYQETGENETKKGQIVIRDCLVIYGTYGNPSHISSCRIVS